MISALISSKTRIKLLLKFFLNKHSRAYLRGLEGEFGESSNAIRLELNRLESAGMLVSSMEGNKKFFQANTQHPLFGELHSIMRKHIGLDHIVEEVVERLGEVEKVYLVGDFSRGIDSQVIDLLLIGEVDVGYLARLARKAEQMVNRKIRYLIYRLEEFDEQLLAKYDPEPLLLWQKD